MRMRARLLDELASDDDDREWLPQPRPNVPPEAGMAVVQRYPEILSLVLASSTLSSVLERLLGPNVVVVLNRHNHISDNLELAGQGRLHRDVLQWSRPIVTVIVYIDHSNIENGCTTVVPGSHFLPFVGVTQSDGGGTWLDEQDYRDMATQALPVPCDAGDVLLIDGLTFHASGVNLAGDTRRTLTLGVRSADELDIAPDPSQEEVITGARIYRRNDRGLREISKAPERHPRPG